MKRRSPLFWIGVAGIGAISLLCLCFIGFAAVGSQLPTPTAIAAQPTVAPTEVVMLLPTETAIPIATIAPTDSPSATVAPTTEPTVQPATDPSNGLGMSRESWEARNGSPLRKGVLGQLYNNGTEVTFIDGKAWRVDFGFASPIPPTDAHSVGRAFLPEDAKLTKTYQASDVTTVNLYHSAWLATRFGDDQFVGGEPGDFTLQYNVYDGNVNAIIIALGNNP